MKEKSKLSTTLVYRIVCIRWLVIQILYHQPSKRPPIGSISRRESPCGINISFHLFQENFVISFIFYKNYYVIMIFLSYSFFKLLMFHSSWVYDRSWGIQLDFWIRIWSCLRFLVFRTFHYSRVCILHLYVLGHCSRCNNTIQFLVSRD